MTGWGVVGCGWVARDYALPVLRALDGVSVVGVQDLSCEALARVPEPGTTDLAQLLATPGLDAVYVATPNHAHRAAVEQAAAAGVAVLLEKPLAADAADADAIVAACRDRVLLGTAYDQRFHPAHVVLRERLADLGTVTAVRIAYGCWLPPSWSPDGHPHDNWRADPQRAGGGAALDLAPHGLDLVGVLLGEDVEVLHALTQRRVHDYPVDDGAVLHGRTASGVLVSLHVSYNTPDPLPRRRLEVIGTEGSFVAVDTMGQTGGGSLVHRTPGAPSPVPVRFDQSSPFQAQLAAFTAAVRGEQHWPHPAERDLRLHHLLLEALT